MTCIVGLHNNGVLFFGRDSISVSSYNKILNRDAKVFIRDTILFGTSGSVRLRNLLQYNLLIPHYKRDEDPMHYLMHDFIEAVRNCFQQYGFKQKIKESRRSKKKESLQQLFFSATRQTGNQY